MKKKQQKHRKSKKLIIWTIIGAILLIALTIIGTRISIFQANQATLVQYAGNFHSDEEWSDGLVASKTTKIGDYRFETEITDYGVSYSDYSCRPNTCGGTEVSIDGNGCAIYRTDSKLLGSCSDSGSKTAGCSLSFTGENLRCEFEGKCNTAKICENGKQVCTSTWSSGTQTASIKVYGVTECGGSNRTILSEGRGCWGKYKIYNGNILVYDSEEFTKNDLTEKIELGNGGSIEAIFRYSQSYIDGSCRHIDTSYRFEVPADAFQVNISSPKSAFAEGDDAYVTVSVTNKFIAGVSVNLSIEFEIDAGLKQTAKERSSKILELPFGESQFRYEIPTRKAADDIKVRPRIDVLLPGSYFSGLNVKCYLQESSNLQPVESCSYVMIGSSGSEEFQTAIIAGIPQFCLDAGYTDPVSCNEYAKAQTSKLLLEIGDQTGEIAELQERVEIGAEQIILMNATIKEMASTIAKLNENIKDKERIIAEVRDSLDTSDERVQFILAAIDEMGLDLDDVKRLLNDYDSELDDDASLIAELDLENDELRDLVSGYKDNYEKEIELVEVLKSKNEKLNEQLSDYTPKKTNYLPFIIAGIVVIAGVAVVVALLKSR